MIKTEKIKNKLSGILTMSSRAYQKNCKALIDSSSYLPSNEGYNLTICNKKKFMWFRVAKVGTRTIFDLFEQAKVNLDAEHAMWCHYPLDFYKDYFKFAFVRNPWDRLFSCWENKVVDSNYFNFPDDVLSEMQAFKNFVYFVEHKNVEACDQHICLQSRLIDLNNINFIGRFENFEEDLSKMIKIIDLGSVNISHKNKSSSKHNYRDIYNEKLKEKVGDIYSKDINLFQYKF